MVKRKASPGRFLPPDNERIIELLRTVPKEAFFKMVARAGLPTEEARELCALFKDLKG